jgi:hypothetical protein
MNEVSRLKIQLLVHKIILKIIGIPNKIVNWKILLGILKEASVTSKQLLKRNSRCNKFEKFMAVKPQKF